MINALTIDVEDYFQVHAFSKVIKYEDWEEYECRVEHNTHRLLNILNETTHNSALGTHNSTKGTFFVLGWIAERYPNLVRRIKGEGHEIACHGYAHKLVYSQSREEFREDITKAKAILEDIIGSEVIGYRAPSYSITNRSRWVFEILIEEGFKYDSSIFPIRHDFYGFPNAPRFPFFISLNGNSGFQFSMLNFEARSSVLNARQSKQQHFGIGTRQNSITPSSELGTQQYLIEFPVSTVRLFGQNLPISGGGYFRLFPYSFIKRGLRSINEKENKPFIFYVHPWEFDAEQPRIKNAANLSKFRHYVNLDQTEVKFRKLLQHFKFSTIKELLGLNRSMPPLHQGIT